jgi:2-polyprenyl-3-methyl-5-hydroxy-6-metoxy-1,4-benzoquinol methylase
MTSSLNEIESCEVCENRDLRPVLSLGPHPMCDDLVPIGDARECKTYPIEILFCDTCRTAHQRFQIPKDQLFPPTYHYRSRQTADVLSGMRQLVEACAREAGPLESKKVLDIGCNDGSLLSIFRDRGAKTFGIEPTDAAHDASALGHSTVKAFLSAAVASGFLRAHGAPDIITFTNVFAHIEDLPGVIRALAVLKSSGTVLVIENHYLGAIVAKHQFDTFYHEHPRTYSFRSFTRIAEALGMHIARAEFPQRYGGNIRVFMRSGPQARPSPIHDEHAQIEAHESSYGSDLVKLSSQIELWRERKRAALEGEFRQHGRLRAKAFPGRAAIPINLLGLDENMISAVYEKPGSPKIGHYVPGTRIPILSDDDFSFASTDQLTPMLNSAWHIRSEIEPYLRRLGFRGRIIDIISQDDFSPRS